MVANVEIATPTPPIGPDLFVTSGISELPAPAVARGVLPFHSVRMFGLAPISLVPAISLPRELNRSDP